MRAIHLLALAMFTSYMSAGLFSFTLPVLLTCALKTVNCGFLQWRRKQTR